MNKFLQRRYCLPLALGDIITSLLSPFTWGYLSHKSQAPLRIPEDFFGINIASSEDERCDDYVLDRLRELGINNVRMGFSYCSFDGSATRFLDKLLDEKFAVSLYDRIAGLQIFVTGSSSKLLQSEISTLISGRYISKTVYPLSLKEFLDFKKIKYSPLIKTPKLYNQLREYLEFGGFPKIVLEKNKHNKRILLAEYFNSIVERDIVLRHQVKNIKDIREIISFVFANISKQTSTYKLEKNFGISSQNIRRYFEYFNEAFLLQFAPFFSYSVKKQIYNPQKIFSIDTGLRNAVSFKFSDDIGKLLENIVFVEFLRKKEKPYYWENGTEVDFLIRKGYQVSELFNICYSLEDEQTLDREIKSLEKGMAEFKKSKAKLIYWEGEPIKHSKIKFVNILDFLLN